MENKLVRSILAGVVATAVMTVFMYVAPMMGLPKMNIPQMLSGMLGVSILIGWMMHFMIGIIFAAGYVYLFNPHVHIHSKVGKGLLYGVVVYMFGMLMMFLMSKLMPMPVGMMKGNMMLMIIGAFIVHLVFGLFVGLIVPVEENTTVKNRFDQKYQVS